MAFTVSEMREAVSSLYSGAWPLRVSYMKANQVQAIFVKNFNKDGTPKPRSKKKNKQDEKTHDYQISVWDILYEKEGKRGDI